MSEELQSLLDKINADGISKAEAERKKIIADAEAQAADIIAAARSEAELLLSNAEKDAANFKQRAISSAGQAARDIMLQLRSELNKRLNSAINGAVSASLTPEFMAELIRELTAAFAAAPDADIDVRCAVKDVSALDAALKGALADNFIKAPVILAAPEISGGIQVDFQDGNCFFDFSDSAVTELLADYAGEQLAAVFKA